MDKQGQNNELLDQGQANKSQSTKYQQIIQNPSNYKLDISLTEVNQERRQLNIFQKKIISNQNVQKNGTQKRDRKFTLSPSNENSRKPKQKEQNQQIQTLSMQTRPDLQDLLSPLNYYFHKKELTSPVGHYLKTMSPESPSKKIKSPFRISKRDYKNQQIYEKIYQTLKNQQSLNSKKQNKRNLFLNSKGSQMDSYLNNSPLNLSVINSLDFEQQKLQVLSTKSQLQQNSNKQNYQPKTKIQIRAASSNNQSSLQDQCENYFQKLSTEISQSSPKNLSNSVIGQHTNKESFQNRKVLSVFKHRQIYNQQLNKKEEITNNEDLSIRALRTYESADISENLALKTVNSETPQIKLKTEDPNNIIYNSRYQKEHIPSRLGSRQNKIQQDQDIQDTQNQVKIKKQAKQQLKLDMSLIQFDQQFIVLSNNQSVKEKLLKENLQKGQANSILQQNNKTSHQFQSQESGKNIMQKKQNMRHQHSFSINFMVASNKSQIENNQKSTKNNQNNSQEENHIGKIQKQKIAKKYLKDILEQNGQIKLQCDLEDDEILIQNIINKYSYKKVYNQQRLRQQSFENQKPLNQNIQNRFLNSQQNENPGPGEYNLPGMSDKYNLFKNFKKERHHLNHEPRFSLTPFKEKQQQLLVTNYFSPKVFNSTDNTIQIPHNQESHKINHNQTISYN
ncbi:hypothetical protein ABPG72_014522 [Tetrahymena utriculariae]